jgi:hypothetical protein
MLTWDSIGHQVYRKPIPTATNYWTYDGIGKLTSNYDTTATKVLQFPDQAKSGGIRFGNAGFLTGGVVPGYNLIDMMTTSDNKGRQSIFGMMNESIRISAHGFLNTLTAMFDTSLFSLSIHRSTLNMDENALWANVNLGTAVYPWDSTFLNNLQLKNLSGSGSILGIDGSGNVIKTTVGESSKWTEDLTGTHHYLYPNNATDSIGIGFSFPIHKLDVLGDINAVVLGDKTAISGYSPTGTAIYGYTGSVGTAVNGFSPNGTGVEGYSPIGTGVQGYSGSGAALYGISHTGHAGWFTGRVRIDTMELIKAKLRTGLDTILMINHDTVYKQILPTGTTYTGTSPINVLGSVISADTSTSKTGLTTLYQNSLKQNTGSYELTTNKITDSHRSTSATKYYNAVSANAIIDSVAALKQNTGSYELSTNKSNVTGTSIVKYATQNLVKTYADSIKGTVTSATVGLNNLVNYLQVKVADSNKTASGNYVTRKRLDSIAALKLNINNPAPTGVVANASFHKVISDSAVSAGYHGYGNSSTAITVYCTRGNMMGITRTGNCTVTLAGMVAGQTVKIIFTYESSATAYTVAFSPTVKWPGGTALTFTNTSGAIDVVAIFYDGTNYYATGLAAFQ